MATSTRRSGVPWVRVRKPAPDERLSTETLFHEVAFYYPDGDVRATCGRYIPRDIETTVESHERSWPQNVRCCFRCIASVKNRREHHRRERQRVEVA